MKNPIKDTVRNYVRSRRRNRSKSSMKNFFESLELRGPLHPGSLFELLTKRVRANMSEKGIWIKDDSDDLEFVAEYLSCLFDEYEKYMRDNSRYDLVWKIKNGKFNGFRDEYRCYRLIYLKIRTWGLRTKKFVLWKFPLTQYSMAFCRRPKVRPFIRSENSIASTG